MISIRRAFWYGFYAGFAKWLPCSYSFFGRGLGKWARAFAGRRLLAHCGQRVNIERGASFGSGIFIHLGDDSDLGVHCDLRGEVHIGNNSFMGPHVTIWTQNHEISRTDIAMMYQGKRPEQPVWIGDDVWIGTHVIILPGVRIGDHAVVGAGAVVAKSVPEWAVVVGNPAKVVKFRNQAKP